jgi:multidrug resistance efflux pump
MADTNTSSPAPDRKVIGKSFGLGIVVGAVLICLIAIWVYINRPETDDATLRANFIGVAPHASGHIVQLLVNDNQSVQEGTCCSSLTRAHTDTRSRAPKPLWS